MSEWTFLTEANVIISNHSYWMIGMRPVIYECKVAIYRGYMNMNGIWMTDEYSDGDIRKEFVETGYMDFLVVGFMDNPEGKSSYFAPKPDEALIEKVIYLSNEVRRINKENKFKNLPSLLDKIKKKEPEPAQSFWSKLCNIFN